MSYEVEFKDIFLYEEKGEKKVEKRRISVTVERQDEKNIRVNLYNYDSCSGSLRDLPPFAWEQLKLFVDELIEEAKRWRPMGFKEGK